MGAVPRGAAPTGNRPHPNLPPPGGGGRLSVLLPDGRLHLQHGPIDIIAEAFGAPREVISAYQQAGERFQTVLQGLVDELAILRMPVGRTVRKVEGPIARRMVKAVWPYRRVYITPMAAVAGAVADEVLAAMLAGRQLARAYVNNGGDIALHLAPGESLSLGVVANQDRPMIDARAEIRAEDPVRGIATSGWRGRSQSLGIADAVTILATTAATADAAATMVANAVNVDHPAIIRRPARSLRDDSDLGDLPVTVDVGHLPKAAIRAALDRGAARARGLIRRGLIHGAWLALQGEKCAVLTPALRQR
ncbi:UPF0280 family protein [Desertibaculum subflavum]|uniref:UPF0280 family protein n=1 Tax=Desertibaculum subflavum TaxID=2268458 RepID=UPI0034D1B0A8